ncbi:hypothetical protein BN938_1257 [Mucinivorans hirudinis]|uniref:Peptide-N-glycosidase F N-terminal domain-containing protein n=1 Tax=Mucinivorans hirudinis TaxID=1433126 RepID=A0A060R7S2_9BACT|nr:hypothetical protein BN938_1257 [Mucinivorans hirudinis]
MKKLQLILLLLTTVADLTAQVRAAKVTGADVFYKNGAILKSVATQSLYYRPQQEGRRQSSTPQEFTYVDFAKMKYYQMTVVKGDTIAVEIPFEYDKNLTVTGSEKLNGWDCKVARTSVNSNSIEIWYTEYLDYKGTPMPAWGVPRGLVVKIIRNGNTMFEAERIDQTAFGKNLLPESFGKIVDEAEYRWAINNAGVQEIVIFNNDKIGFTGAVAPDNFDEEEKLYSVGGGTVILKKVKLPENTDRNSIFAEVSQYAVGDAYDRTGSIFVIPVGKEKSFLNAIQSLKNVPAFVSDSLTFPALISTANYDVPVELMRFFTTFGVRGYNHIKVKGQNWADSVIYKTDVTHLAPLLKGEAWIGAYIGNWDSRGHNLSLKLKYHPGGRANSQKVIIPLFNTLNILEQAGQSYPTFFDRDSLRVSFDITSDLRNVQMVYITTGHGGWGGGDEFNQKLNTIYLDSRKVFSFIPWREDCASYRNLNPASGNFNNGTSSSDLSRSNWCPGTVTNPVYIPIGDLKKGEHTVSVQIPLGKPEGGSFSYWCISGFLIGEK